MTVGPYRHAPVPYNPAELPRYLEDELSRISTFIEELRETQVRYRGEYDSSKCYQKGDLVWDGDWTMIANKDTCDRPAPQPSGQPYWVSGFPDSGDPGWVEQSTPAQAQLMTGQRYTTSKGGYISGARVWQPVAPDVGYELWTVYTPTTTPQFNRYNTLQTPSDTDWSRVDLPPVPFVAGTIYDVLLVARSQGTTSSFADEWDYKQQNGTPSEGEAWHQSNNYELRIHNESKNSLWDSELSSLQPGDTVTIGAQTYDIQENDVRASHVRLAVTPEQRIGENTYMFSFTQFADVPLEYVQIANHYSGVAEVDGIRSDTNYDGLVVNSNAYGVDLQLQDAIVSEDWDYVAYSPL